MNCGSVRFVDLYALQAWQRPTLPMLKQQYHWRGGISRPSSRWDRVLGPSLRPPGQRSIQIIVLEGLARMMGPNAGDACLREGVLPVEGRSFDVFLAGHDGDCLRSLAIELYRAISTGRLRLLLDFDLRPINVVVFHGSQGDLVLR